MKWFLAALKNYAVFRGRARRMEFWMFNLFCFLIGIGVALLDGLIGAAIGGFGFGVLFLIFNLVIIIPSLSVSVRRLHDVGKSGWFLLISLIPIIGGIWLFVLFCSEGNLGPNKYGEDPKTSEGFATNFA